MSPKAMRRATRYVNHITPRTVDSVAHREKCDTLRAAEGALFATISRNGVSHHMRRLAALDGLAWTAGVPSNQGALATRSFCCPAAAPPAFGPMRLT